MSRLELKDPGQRYYEKLMPDANEVVMVRVVNRNDTSAYVQLLEYGNIEGMIPFTELTRLRVRSLANFVKIGKIQAAQVLRMDKERGYIDLSKKVVTKDEAKKSDERFQRAKIVHSIMRHASDETKIPLIEVMQMVAWPLYKTNSHAFNALKHAVVHPDEVFGPLNLPEELVKVLTTTIQHRLKPQPMRIRVDVSVKCFTSEGIECIRDVLRIGQAEGEREPKIPLQVAIIAPPSYSLRTVSEHKDEAIQRLREAVLKMKEEMAKRGGSVEMPKEPYVAEEGHEKARGAEKSDDEDGSDEEAEEDEDEDDE